MNGCGYADIEDWNKEYLIERYKDLVEIEKEHKKENGRLREEVTHWKGKYHLENRRYLDLYDKKINVPIINATEEMLQQYVEKSKVREKIDILNTNIVNAERFDRDYIGNCRFAKYILQELLEEGDDK